MRLLYLTYSPDKDNNGANAVTVRNFQLLNSISEDIIVDKYLFPKPTFKSLVISVLTACNYGVTQKAEQELYNYAIRRNYDYIFFEGSLMGKSVKRLSKKMKTIVFMHNIEALLFQQRFKESKSLVSLLRWKFGEFNERRSLAHANHIIVLNKRDSTDLFSMYHRKAGLILPITYPVHSISVENQINIYPYYCLFVGSNFAPNVHGCIWFIENVAPYIHIDIWIIGTCCDEIRRKNILLPSNVKLKGYVDDIDVCYLNASFVIAPIFWGSGMKTKTVEALSFYKTIYGTSEAFEGIEGHINRIGALCNSANEFIHAINGNNNVVKTNLYSKELFMRKYSNQAAFVILKKFMCRL